MITLGCPDVELVVGPPGCGKTQEAIRIVREHIRMGVNPESIGFISFTRQAVSEASERLLIEPKPKWFRTLHSICYELTASKREGVIDGDEIHSLRDEFGPDITRYLFIHDLARIEESTPQEVWRRTTEIKPISWTLTKRFCDWYDNYKAVSGRYDFIDLLENYLRTPLAPVLDLVVIDEAQDLTLLQWAVAKAFTSNTKKVILFGDPDQSIYDWAGVQNVLEQVEYGSRRVLSQSHRVPVEVHKRATKILDIREREVEYKPRDAQGSVTLLPTPSSWMSLDLSKGEWLLLVRANYQLKNLEKVIYDRGLPVIAMANKKDGQDSRDRVLNNIKYYNSLLTGHGGSMKKIAYLDSQVHGGDVTTMVANQVPWQKAFSSLSLAQKKYYTSVLENQDTANIRIATFHGAKGAESDNVIVFGGYPRAVERSRVVDPDPELRLLYVALTRARENLYLSPGAGELRYKWKEMLWG